jgi:integrase
MPDPAPKKRKRRSPQGLYRLSALTVDTITAPGWHADGGGLYLEVDRSGRKRWALRLTVNGKRCDFGLGPIHKVPLQTARERATLYREKAYAGIYPVERSERDGAPLAGALTFERAADEVHRIRKAQWSNGKHVDQWINTLTDHAFPHIGKKPVASITTADVLTVLSEIWLTKPETARRLRQRIRTVLDWARAAGHRAGDNPVDLIGDALPKHRRRVAHHKALPYAEVGAFIGALRTGGADPVTKAAFEFLILTTARTQEARLATWSELDIEGALWTVPKQRMKARREHLVPLPPRAVEILKGLRSRILDPTALVFADAQTGRALSENRFLNARDDLGYRDRCMPHGFRSSFRDWAAEETAFSSEVVEMALAHAIPNKVEAAYRRGDLLAKRRKLMDAWAQYATTVRKPRG